MDHQTETRTGYLARLAVGMGLPVQPIAEHLLTPVEVSEDDEWRIDLAVNVLVDMARRGRGDAVPPLRRYVAGPAMRTLVSADATIRSRTTRYAPRPRTGYLPDARVTARASVDGTGLTAGCR